MSNRVPRQLKVVSDGARVVAPRQRSKPGGPTESYLKVKLDAARMRLHEIVILRIKTWLPAETLKETARGRSVPTRGVSCTFR
jgi:hypothetical protein